MIFLTKKEKKEREEKEREARIAEGLAEEINSSRNIEQALLSKKLGERKLVLYDVSSSVTASEVK